MELKRLFTPNFGRANAHPRHFIYRRIRVHHHDAKLLILPRTLSPDRETLALKL
jgi:hypothetical protein